MLVRWIMREDMYSQAVKLLPAIRADMGSLCESRVESEGPATAQGRAADSASTATVMTIDK